jgi:hypothetical protein
VLISTLIALTILAFITIFVGRNTVKNRYWPKLPIRITAFALIFLTPFSTAFLKANLNNPNSSISTVERPFKVTLNSNDELEIEKNPDIDIDASNFLSSLELKLVNGAAMFQNATFSSEEPIKARTLDEIIEEIHRIRFSQDNYYVISGGHFYNLYLRNMGIFYNTIIDPRTAIDEQDWINRQIIILKTLALGLETIKQTQDEPPTTVTPVGGAEFITENIFNDPSDSLFAMLYTLSALSDPEFIPNKYPFETELEYELNTYTATQDLLDEYGEYLTLAVQIYVDRVIDTDTGLVRRDIDISSAKDIVKRESSFYDNVVAWKTLLLAEELELLEADYNFEAWRKKIIDTFWDEEEGIFIDDMSEYSLENSAFSADSLIVLQASFLDIDDPADREKFESIAEYIQENGFDDPLPLRYGNNDSELYTIHKFFAPNYQSFKSIWSHWGIEYIKMLILLGDEESLSIAEQHLDTYTEKIVKYGGYPELYEDDGDIFKNNIFYKSVLRTGWVVNFEQAQYMLKYALSTPEDQATLIDNNSDTVTELEESDS